MSRWDHADLARLGRPDEVGISSDRSDGTPRAYVTIWAVATDDGLFVRSAHGRENGWFRRAVSSGTGHVRAEGEERAVRFAPASDDEQVAIDAAYRAKYARYASIVAGITGPDLYDVTLRLDPLE